MSKLGRRTPTEANDLMNIATKVASGEECVGALFHQATDKERRREEEAEGSNPRDSKKKKRGKGRKGKGPALIDDDEDLVAAVNKKGPRAQPPGTFDDMLKKPCPNHKFPVKHTLE